MKPAPATTLAKAKARTILSSQLLAHPCEMAIEDIAYSLGLMVREIDLLGCDGRLLRQGEKGVISVNRKIAEPGKRRLTIAHEIGHFILHQGTSQMEVCDDPGTLACYLREKPEEKEANVFAAELLMPDELVAPMCKKLRPNFDSISAISKEFQVTFTAAAMRFMEFSPERCALVFCQDSRVSWAKPSATFGYFIEGGQRLDAHSHAIDFFEGTAPPKEMTRVFARSWFPGPKFNPDAQLYEQCFAMDRYKSVLALLWLDQEIEEQDQEPSDTGRRGWYQPEGETPDY